MALLLKVEASEFLGRATTGRSQPMLCACYDSDGRSYSVYVKYAGFHEDLTTDHLVGELISNLFAKDLGLPVAEPCLVTIDQDFLHTVPDETLRKALAGVPLVAFGSVQLSPARRWNTSDLVRRNQLADAASLYLFDTLVENTDRGNGNPNLLMSGLSFKIIDFGHSFQRCHYGQVYAETRMPWQLGGVGNHYPGTLQHIMYPSSKRLSADELAKVIDAFTTALEDLTDDRIMAYVEKVPPDWNQVTAMKIIDYLVSARKNSSSFINQVRGVLK